jgi:hypothetical protein
MLGSIVHYAFDAEQVHIVAIRNPNGARGQVPGGPLPQPGDVLSALILHEYGDAVVDLRVHLRGTANHYVAQVPQGSQGTPGRWWAPA